MSGAVHGADVDLSSVRGAAASDGGVAHGAALVAFAEAVMGDDASRLEASRATVRERLGDAAFVDCCAVIGAFNVVDRVADATGIPVDDMLLERSKAVRDELELGRFSSAANTPRA